MKLDINIPVIGISHQVLSPLGMLTYSMSPVNKDESTAPMVKEPPGSVAVAVGLFPSLNMASKFSFGFGR